MIEITAEDKERARRYLLRVDGLWKSPADCCEVTARWIARDVALYGVRPDSAQVYAYRVANRLMSYQRQAWLAAYRAQKAGE